MSGAVGVSGSRTEPIQNSDSGEWKMVTIELPTKQLLGAELELSHEGGDDTVFHMVEIERKP